MGVFGTILNAAVVTATLAAAQASRFKFYDLKTPLASPCDLYSGPDGNIYATTFTADKLVKIDRTSANPKLTEITIPYTRDQLPLAVLPQRLQGAGSCVVQPGMDGNVYAATGIRNELVQYNPRNGKFKLFENTGGSAGNLQPFNDAWPAKDGLWFTQTTANVLTFFDYKTEKMTSYEVPTPLASPIGVYVTPDGNVWVCEFLGQKVAKFNPKTKEFTEYPVPVTLLGPSVVRAMTEGKYLWFTAIDTNSIGRINIFTGEFKAYPDTANLGIPLEDTVSGKGNIWFSTTAANSLNYLIPSTGEVKTVNPPNSGLIVPPVSLPPAVTVAMHWVSADNSMWFTQLVFNRIGRYQLRGNQ